MRSNKYRVWDTQEKRWADESLVCLFPDGEVYEVWFDDPPQKAEPGRYIVELATNLPDKNGKGIFEGDIVRIGNEERAIEDGTFLVTWGEFSDCCVEGETWILGDFWQPTLYYHHEDAEVIGNLYETPELLPKDEVQE